VAGEVAGRGRERGGVQPCRTTRLLKTGAVEGGGVGVLASMGDLRVYVAWWADLTG
jgi:hypothetical protein